MLLYLCLVLLPSASLAPCGDDQAVWQLFRLIDENNNGNVTSEELDQLFKEFDLNKDRRVTSSEIIEKLPDRAPELQGRQAALVNYFDPKNGREITAQAADEAFTLCNTNKDEVCSRQEYKTLLYQICGQD